MVFVVPIDEFFFPDEGIVNDEQESNGSHDGYGRTQRTQVVSTGKSVGKIRIPPRHACQSQEMLGKEGQVDTHEHQSEVNLAVDFVVDVTRDLAESEVETGEDAEDGPHGQDVMEMGHHVVSVVKDDV